jgi:hypothetical protein
MSVVECGEFVPDGALGPSGEFRVEMATSSHSGISSIFPTAIYVQGSEQLTLSVNHTPFTVGRKVDRDLVIPDPRV